MTSGAPGPDSAPPSGSAHEGCREQGWNGRACRASGVCAGAGGQETEPRPHSRETWGPPRGQGTPGGGGRVPAGPGFTAGKLRLGGQDALACAAGARAPGWVIQPEGGLGHRGGAPGSLGQGGSLGDDLIR